VSWHRGAALSFSLTGMRELRAGLWHWQAPHPDWTPGARWPQEVSSYAIDDGERLLFFDPLAVPEELLALAPEREPAIVLTAPWHERDTRTLVARLGAAVFAPPPDTAQDLMDKYGITAEQAGDGSPDLQWLRSGGGEVHWYGAGERLPIGIAAHAGREHNDLVLWQQNVRAVIAGDSLVDFGPGLALNEWLRSGLTRQQVVQVLRPLLDLPVEAVCPAHGPPTDRAALERALSL
jgi:glyoxylase-like metal-dependent hydrolase (beta-lactamase superfamily II)